MVYTQLATGFVKLPKNNNKQSESVASVLQKKKKHGNFRDVALRGRIPHTVPYQP